MRTTSSTLAVIVVLGLAFAGVNAQAPFGATCSVDTDCYSTICSAGKCTNCLVNSNCNTFEYCNTTSGQCVYGTKVLGETCAFSKECSADLGLFCDKTTLTCQKQKLNGELCLSNFDNAVADCAFGLFCKSNNPLSPSIDGHCTALPVLDERCIGAIGCAPEYTCDVNLLVPVCIFLRTNSTVCNSDRDCGTGQYCSTTDFGPGACTDRKATAALCQRNRECVTNSCVDGLCSASRACTLAGNLNTCGVGYTCNTNGLCIESYDTGSPCKADTECTTALCTVPTGFLGSPTKYCQGCTSATPPNGSGECSDPAFSPTPNLAYCSASSPIRTCQLREDPGTPCSADFQCGSFQCVNNTCSALPNGVQCEQDSACPDGSFCPPQGLAVQPKICTSLLPIGSQCTRDTQCGAPPGAQPFSTLCDTENPYTPVCTFKCDGVPASGVFPGIPANYVCPAGYFCPDAKRVDINTVRACRKPFPDGVQCDSNSQCISGRCAKIDASTGTCLPTSVKLPDGYLCSTLTPSDCFSGSCVSVSGGNIGSCAASPKLPAKAVCYTDEQCLSGVCQPALGQTYGFCTAVGPKLAGGEVCKFNSQCASNICSYNSCNDFTCPYGACLPVVPKLPDGAFCDNSAVCDSGICRYVVTDPRGRCWRPASPPPPPVQVPVPFYGKRNQLRNNAPGGKYLPVSPSPFFGKRKLQAPSDEESSQ